MEQRIQAQDREILEVKQMKNTLESYAYDIRDGLNSHLDQFVQAQEKQSILKSLDEVIEWIYSSEGENAPKS